MNNPTNSIGRNRSLFTIFQPWGSQSTYFMSPPFPGESALPLFPKRLKGEQKPQMSPFPYLKPAAQTVLQSLWKVPKSPFSRSSSALQDRGCVAVSLHVVVQESMCCVTRDHGKVQERHKSQESGLPMCPESQASASCKAES